MKPQNALPKSQCFQTKYRALRTVTYPDHPDQPGSTRGIHEIWMRATNMHINLGVFYLWLSQQSSGPKALALFAPRVSLLQRPQRCRSQRHQRSQISRSCAALCAFHGVSGCVTSLKSVELIYSNYCSRNYQIWGSQCQCLPFQSLPTSNGSHLKSRQPRPAIHHPEVSTIQIRHGNEWTIHPPHEATTAPALGSLPRCPPRRAGPPRCRCGRGPQAPNGRLRNHVGSAPDIAAGAPSSVPGSDTMGDDVFCHKTCTVHRYIHVYMYIYVYIYVFNIWNET